MQVRPPISAQFVAADHLGTVGELDAVEISFSPESLKILNGVLALLMFSIALDIRIEDFRELVRQPKPAVVGLASEYLFLPLLTLALIYGFVDHPSIALGMVLLAVCPGGSVSNYATYLAKANTALSVMLTAVTTLGAAVVTPLAFAFWQGWLPEALQKQLSLSLDFWDMATTVFFLVLVPVVIGVGLNEFRPNWANRLRKPFKILSAVIFIAFVLIAIYGNLSQIGNYVKVVFWMTAAHNGLALLGGYWIGRASGLGQMNSRTVSLETGLQNSGLGMTLVFTFFPQYGGMAIVLAWWGIWHLISGFLLAYYWGLRPPREWIKAGPRERVRFDDADRT